MNRRKQFQISQAMKSRNEMIKQITRNKPDKKKNGR